MNKNKSFIEFMKKVSSSETLKEKVREAHDMETFQKTAESEGYSISKEDLVSFFRKQASAIKANVAGTDGNGTLVFGRDWAYPGPDTDSKVIM